MRRIALVLIAFVAPKAFADPSWQPLPNAPELEYRWRFTGNCNALGCYKEVELKNLSTRKVRCELRCDVEDVNREISIVLERVVSPGQSSTAPILQGQKIRRCVATKVVPI